MFNRYIDASTTTYVPDKIEHREFRAPTEDSIRLAKEYEKEITSKIIGQIVFGDNTLEFPKGQAIYIRKNFKCLSDDIYICFKLNGRLYEKHLEINGDDWRRCDSDDQKEILNVFLKKISESITEEMINHAIHSGSLNELLNVHKY